MRSACRMLVCVCYPLWGNNNLQSLRLLCVILYPLINPCVTCEFSISVCVRICLGKEMSRLYSWGHGASKSTINLGNGLLKPTLITAGKILLGISWRGPLRSSNWILRMSLNATAILWHLLIDAKSVSVALERDNNNRTGCRYSNLNLSFVLLSLFRMKMLQFGIKLYYGIYS